MLKSWCGRQSEASSYLFQRTKKNRANPHVSKQKIPSYHPLCCTRSRSHEFLYQVSVKSRLNNKFQQHIISFASLTALPSPATVFSRPPIDKHRGRTPGIWKHVFPRPHRVKYLMLLAIASNDIHAKSAAVEVGESQRHDTHWVASRGGHTCHTGVGRA